MHYIIETEEQLSQLPPSNIAFIHIVPLNDLVHPALTAPCLVYYHHTSDDKPYIICVNHPESLNIKWEVVKNFLESKSMLWCHDIKYHSYFLFNKNYTLHEVFNIVNVVNLNTFNTPIHDHLYKSKYYHVGLNQLIPISKHYEKLIKLDKEQKLSTFDNTHLTQEQQVKASALFYIIEKNGIGCDPKKINKYFELNYAPHSMIGNKIYTKYNLFNKTTRPTNAFNGINFSAIPKDKRDAFEPTNYIFVEFDFNGYHPRLLNNHLKEPFHFGDNIYLDLANQMGTDVETAKISTFRQLYGGITLNTPYFRAASEFTDKLWQEYNGGLFGDKRDLTPSKLLNYYLQYYETERNIAILRRLLHIFGINFLESKIVLYNYDSFLIDMTKDEMKYIPEIVDICEYNTSFDQVRHKVKVATGDNYGNLTRI